MFLELVLLMQPASQGPRSTRELEEFIARQQTVQERTLSAEADRKYREHLLQQRHYDFIIAFNLYLDSYKRGMVNIKHLKDAVKAWEKLRDTEGFKEYADRKSK